MDKNIFGARVASLRTKKDVSAREMSLAIGQSEGYINNIENKVNYPSMAAFFYICDYLGITPVEFFDTELKDPKRVNELMSAVKGLSGDQLQDLINIAKNLKR